MATVFLVWLTVTLHIVKQVTTKNAKQELRVMESQRMLTKELELCIEPLDPTQFPENIVNIVSGELALASINVENAVANWNTEMQDYENTLSSGFYRKFMNK